MTFIFDSLKNVIKTSGGSVETGKRVIRLETENNIVTRVVCEDGSSYDSDFLFVTFREFMNTFFQVKVQVRSKLCDFVPFYCVVVQVEHVADCALCSPVSWKTKLSRKVSYVAVNFL